jgi:hypothetical protein
MFNDWMPESKWFSSVAGSGIVAFIMWVVSLFGLTIDPSSATGAVVLGGLAAHYFIPEKNIKVANKVAARNGKVVTEARSFEVHTSD